MLHNRKQLAEKDKKAVFSREIVTKNPVFGKQHCEDFFEMFNLYCDNRRQCDIADILNTARTLGFDKKYKIIYEALESITTELNGEWVDFETFLKLITDKLGNPFSESGRRAMFTIIDPTNKENLDFDDLKRISDQMKYNLTAEDIQEVINNVAGFGKKEITWEQFNKYIAKKVDKKAQTQ